MLNCIISYSYCYDGTFRNTSITAIEFGNTNSRVESFNAEFEEGLRYLNNLTGIYIRIRYRGIYHVGSYVYINQQL